MSVGQAASTFRVEGVRVFDGTRTLPRATVEVERGVVTNIIASPGRAPTHTLIPGLIDSHVHAWGSAEKVLARNLLFGVTTVLEMMSDGDGLTEISDLRRQNRADLADIYSSGFGVTVAGGHGTEYGFDVPVVAEADDVPAFIDARVAEGSDFIKVLHFAHAEPEAAAWRFAILKAAVGRAHELGKLVAVHATTAAAAWDALEAGADCLAHVFADRLDVDTVRMAKERAVFVIPTLSVVDAASGSIPGAQLLEDPRVSAKLTSFDRRQLASSRDDSRRQLPGPPTDMGVMREMVRRFAAASVPILAGTDSPNPGIAHGASLHGELHQLVDAGLKPEQALSAATAVPAACFGLKDRGEIAIGRRADMVLVEGNPTEDIKATRAVQRIWKQGVERA